MAQKTPFAVGIGERIAKRRSQMGLTQEQAAELCGLSHQFFACVENGIKNMRADSIVKVSRGMEVSTDYILLGISSDVDRNHLVKLMEPLDEIQLKCLEEIIQNYVIACTHSRSES